MLSSCTYYNSLRIYFSIFENNVKLFLALSENSNLPLSKFQNRFILLSFAGELFCHNVDFLTIYFFISEMPPRQPINDLETLWDCNTANDCPPYVPQCNNMLSPTPSGKNGYCVVRSCRTNRDCPSLGNECGKGSLSGTCNAGNTCEYDPVLALANCGKKKVFDFKGNT